jgi:hypothetical protein
MWFGYQRDRVVVLENDKTSLLSTAQGVQVGDVTVIRGDKHSLWIGGDRGVAVFDKHRFHALVPADEVGFSSITGIVPTDGDGLWIGESQAILHVPEPELRQFMKDPNYRVSYETFDTLDGLPALLQTFFPAPSAIQGVDGIIWFATTSGLVSIDPKHLPKNVTPPPVSILQITVPDKKTTDWKGLGEVQLPARTTSLRISYTALSLSIPERVRFRYRLKGQDASWQEAGTRREAFYTNLGPGTYSFQVIACNNDGVWNETGATLLFTIAPAYYQTWWCRLLYFTLGAGCLYFFYLYRLRRATALIHQRFGAQMEERERIARELHDTLLQGFQGLVLRFQAVMKMLPAEEPAHQIMARVLDRADEILLEGRQSVRDIREEGSMGTDLSDSLLRCGQELAQDYNTLFSLTMVGEARPISPVVFDESYRIVREALINAFQHSHAVKIEVEITYQDTGLCLRIRDDGSGIDEAVLSKGRSGHWGLSGMRERAKKIGSELDIWSNPGAGTEIELKIPSEVAYPRTSQGSLWERLRRTSRRQNEV